MKNNDQRNSKKCENILKDNGGRLQRTVKLMKEQMKLCDEEITYRKDYFSKNDEKEHMKYFRCTKCGKSFQKNIACGESIPIHPLLDVLLCTSCCDYYGDGNFSLDSEGEDKYCRWCGEGGTIFSCSKCICAFCENCVKKHFGEKTLHEVQNDDDWVCYFCNPKPLWYLRYIKSLAEKISLQNKNEPSSKNNTEKSKKRTANECFNSSDESSSLSHFRCEVKKKKKKKKLRSFSEDSHATSENEKTNRVKLRNKNNFKMSSSDSSDEILKIPAKKNKIKKRPSKISITNQKDSVVSQKGIENETIVDKLKGIWKMLEIVSEIGLSSSIERLEVLEKFSGTKTFEDIQTEYVKLKSVMTMMLPSITKASDFVDSLKSDLSFENDNKKIFQRERTKLKKLAEKFKEESEKPSNERRKSLINKLHPGQETVFNENSINSKKDSSFTKKRRENKSKSVGGSSEEEEETNLPRLNCFFSEDDSDNDNDTDNDTDVMQKKENNDVFNVEESKAHKQDLKELKPLLRVKSFAKMTNENVFDTELNSKKNESERITEKEENSKNISVLIKFDRIKNNSGCIDEYNVETDESSEEEITFRKKKKKTTDGNFSGDSNESKRTMERIKKIKDSFKEFREKRRNYLQTCKTFEKCSKSSKGSLNESDLDESTATSRKNIKRMQIISSDEENVKTSKDKKQDCRSESELSLKISNCTTSPSEGSLDENDKPKKKKLRKKRIMKESLESGESEVEEDKSENLKKGRKNIKRILKKDLLQLDTKEAIKLEEERRNRIEKRETLHKEIFSKEIDENGNSKRLILDFDAETKQPLITVHKKLYRVLKPHQVEGVKFMWNNCFESVQSLEIDSGSGCILAHCMGLGKTLQVITLVHTVMTHDLGVNCVLIICPLSVVSNWLREFEKWLCNINTDSITVYDLLKYKKKEERIFYLDDWQKCGGVMILSYDLFRNLTKSTKGKKIIKSQKKFVEALLNPGPDLIVCDEGHLLKNESTALFKCVNRVKTSRRIVLTGTPLQNNLMEYHCMVQFVKPNILGTKKEFSNRFANPINNGQFEDSTEHDVIVMKRRSHVLHSLLSGCVQRFDYSVLTPFLPEKQEYVLSISLTDTQKKAYRHFIENFSAKTSGNSKGTSLFNDYQNLQRIWTHPRTMLMHSAKESLQEASEVESENSLKDFIVDSDEEETSSKNCSSEDSTVEESTRAVLEKVFGSNSSHLEVIEEDVQKENDIQIKDWWMEFFKESDFEDIRCSNKLLVLFSLLKSCEVVKDKVIVFSQSLYSLDLIEYFLKRVDEGYHTNDELLSVYKNSWVLGLDYFRLDGNTNTDTRTNWCKMFNKESDARARLFLISTRAGGLGINLYAANRVVVFDSSWNPSQDLQSIFRVYRFGQKKTCYIYRFLAEATMEEKIYKRQVTKLSLALRVVDEHQIERHYSMMNLQELYNFEPTDPKNKKTPKVPKDAIFANLLIHHKESIVSYHEHDSLLENQEEEILTEEERKVAWEEFEEEKLKKATLNIENFDQFMHPSLAFGLPLLNQQNLNQQNFNQHTLALPFESYGPNPAFIHSQIPLPILQRGFKLGMMPMTNETSETFLSRVINRELVMGKSF